MIDNKIRSSIVEGISVFLSIFDLPDVARVFCPPAPTEKVPSAASGNGAPPQDEQPGLGMSLRQSLPPLDELIESGKVLALNMPAGTNPALARAVGVMLKNAWLQTLLRRPAQMKAEPDKYFRPAVFICDEYQSFASVGEDDPSGDEKVLCPHPAMPLYPDRCHPIHLLVCARYSAARRPGAPCCKRCVPGYSFP